MDNEKFQELVIQQLGALASDVAGLKQDIAGVKGEIAGLQKDMSSVKEDVSGLKKDMVSVKEDVSGLKKDMVSVKEDVSGLKKDMVGIKEDVQGLKNAVTKIEVRIENEVIEKIRALYDARSLQEDINMRIIDTLDRIEAKLDVLQMETAHIRRVRRNRSL